MAFFKNLFSSSKKKQDEEVKKQPTSPLAIDDAFVHNFINKGGKFIYCLSEEKVKENLVNILEENNWTELSYKKDFLEKFLPKDGVEIINKLDQAFPLFTSCEFLIAENGSILFSSNQIGSERISCLTQNFIVLAKASQIVENNGDSLTGIKAKYPYDIPTNISSINNFSPNNQDGDNFLNYGANNSKNLYLLLLEDF